MGYIGNDPKMNETVTSAEIVDGAIVNADVSSSAAIAFSKMADLTASRLLVSDGNGDVSVSDVTSAEALLLDGGTSATSTTLAAADRLIVNDNGTIVQVALSDFETFFEGAIDTLSSAMTFSSTVTVGSDGSGQDVIFYSGTSGDNLTWDSSEECLTITGTDGAQALKVADGDLVVVDKLYIYDNDGGEYISGDGTNLTITSGADIIFTTASGGSVYYAGAAGTGNTVFGNDAGIQLASGDNYNTFIGHQVADADMTSAVQNTAIGYQAASAITTGSGNNAIGYKAATALTTGSANIVIGGEALDAADGDEDHNIAIGDSAMGAVNDDTSDFNVAIGTNALLGGTAAAIGNVAIGYQSLDATAGNAQTGTVAIGYQALTALTSGAGNVAIGYQAGDALTTGVRNIAIGYTAFSTSINSSGDSIAIGYNAMNGSGTTAASEKNIAIGNYTMNGNQNDSDHNIAVGHQALNGLTTGDGNVAIGLESGKVINSGQYNTLMGTSSGISLTTGQFNTIIGYQAGDALTTMTHNTAIGTDALTGSSLVDQCVIVGSQAATGAVTAAADGTVAVGYAALGALTSGDSNVAIGFRAGETLTTGANNTILGYGAMDACHINTEECVAIGVNAMGYAAGSAKCYRNVAIGVQAMGGAALDDAEYNHAIGYGALNALTSGKSNVAIGFLAGETVTTGGNNVLIGRSAGSYDGADLTTGTRNTCIGHFTKVSASDVADEIVIGYYATGQGHNTVTFGDDSNVLSCSVENTSWSNPSDVRHKEDIQDQTVGLDFINDLRPVTYLWKKRKDIPKEHRAYKEGSDERVMGGKYNHGFIAQEVKEAIDKHSDIKEGFSMWGVDATEDTQRIAPSALIPMLTKAIQELSQQVEDLKKKVG